MHGREYGFFYFNLCAKARGFDAQHPLLAGFALTPGLVLRSCHPTSCIPTHRKNQSGTKRKTAQGK